MSVILITKHNESIYNITDKTVATAQVKTQHSVDTKSNAVQCRKEFRKTLEKNKKNYGVMGKPLQPKADPRDFLKKNTGKPPMIPPVKGELDNRQDKVQSERATIVPTREGVLKEQDAKFRRNKRDYLTLNIKAAVEQVPKTPARRVVIAKDGIKRDLSAGLEPKHLQTAGYGKIPRYLDKLIKSNQKQVERTMDKAGAVQQKCVYITRDEREHLLVGLKQNWEELQRQYQGLPIMTDTIPKMHRKSKLEADLKQLEKDIVLIERHPYIYVYEDENDI